MQPQRNDQAHKLSRYFLMKLFKFARVGDHQHQHDRAIEHGPPICMEPKAPIREQHLHRADASRIDAKIIVRLQNRHHQRCADGEAARDWRRDKLQQPVRAQQQCGKHQHARKK